MKNMNHSIESAMSLGELTEEEAYFVLRYAGRMGYDKAIKRLSPNPLKPLRRWFVWFGGWEKPELLQWDGGKPAWEFRYRDGRWKDPFPLSVLGYRLTIFGKWAQMKFGKGYLVASSGFAYKWPNSLYWSPDGTPQHPRARNIIGRRVSE